MRDLRRCFMLLLGAAVAATLAVAASADVSLPNIFGSHMVLQRDMPLPVWGWAAAGEKVDITLSGSPAVSTTADVAGKWKVLLPAKPAGGPFTLTVSGKNQIVFDDVLIGEVWLCSGQSNMEMTVGSSLNAAQEAAAGDHPRIRQIKIPLTTAGTPQENVPGTWQVCTPATVPGFTAAGYFMARDLEKELGVPIGLVNSSWGGTLIEPWTPPIGFSQVPALSGIYDQLLLADPTTEAHKEGLRNYLASLAAWIRTAQDSLATGKTTDVPPAYPDALKALSVNGQPAAIYNAMIYPLIPYAIRGAIWYQGESNHVEGMLYTEKMKALIGGWRTLWGEGNFPFYFVQIAPWHYGEEDPSILPRFWEAQIAATQIPNTGMASTMDVADLVDIHPKNKQAVGQRLALLALAKTYGKKDVVSSGPTFKSLAVEPGKLRITFDNVGSGLVSNDGKPLTWFEITGEDTDFVPANAVIDGNSVVLSSPDVAQPVAMHYGWHRNAQPNLSNKEGLPALPFRAGDIPKRDWLALKVAEAKDYKLVYDLDLTKLAGDIKYDVDNHASVGAFDRIAYFLELQKPGEGVRYAYASMDAFTDNAGQIGVPTMASGALFQKLVSNMTVISNVPGITTGTGLKGNIEFWPHNYGPPNAAKVPNASATLWDFGDEYVAPVEGYGCMQVHNYEAQQCIMCFNSWRAGMRADVGIGNSDGETRDWTFKANATAYQVARLRVLVHPAK